jgi:hypothetical protein
VAATVPDRP